MIRYRFFLNFSKEEAWLTEMTRQGWALTGVSLGYHFRTAEPQDTPIRIDFRPFTSQAEFVNYYTLFEDSGWQHIAGSRNSGVQYFRRLSADSTEDIFSDAYSRAERYRRYASLWLVLAVALMVILVALGSTGAVDFRSLIEPRRFYLTPGLWELSGDAFWQAFWFETPFALFRAMLVLSFPLLLALYLTCMFKAQHLYHQDKKLAPAA